MKRTYDYYLSRWLEGVNMQAQVDYADPKSVRKYNKGSDVFRKAAAQIGEIYPEKVAEFSKWMQHEDEHIRLCAAISIAQYMPHTREELATILEIVNHRMNNPDSLDPRMGWEWWLKQPWAQEENCTDFAV